MLLYAIYQASKNRHCFEAEALHLVSRNWFAEPVTENEEELNWKYGSRDRRWEVLVDIVSALVFCPPDLPSLYFVTALDSAASRQNHFRQNLLEDRGFLRHVKRLCTMAIADVVLYQLRNAKGKEEASDEIQNTVLNKILKRAYSCFLKLNCTVENVKNWLEKTG